MGKIVAIVNQKGGVGKTTTAVNLAYSLAKAGKKTLLVDIDPQGNASSGVGIEEEQIDYTTYQAMISEVSTEEATIKTPYKKLDLLASNIDLVGAEIELVDEEGRERFLQKALGQVKENYDFILIDCPPSLGLLTINALTAADSVMIPVQCEFYSLVGLGQLMNTIALIREGLNPELYIEGVLLTMYDSRLNISKQVVEEVRQHFGGQIFKTFLSRNVRIAESPSFGKPVMEYDPNSTGAKNYASLAKEFIFNNTPSQLKKRKQMQATQNIEK